MATIALSSAATGLSALNTRLDVIANNLANVNTQGFKASRANFEDLLYIERQQPGTENALGDIKPTGLYVGLGVKVSGTQVSFEAGPPITTGIPTDLRIDGDGFFQVQVSESDAPGGVAFTRAGNFVVNANDELVLANSNGRRLLPIITLPQDRIGDPTITADGRVVVRVPGQAEPEEVGQIQLAQFSNPAGLSQIGENLFAESSASGDPRVGNAGEDTFGSIQQGQLEGSNVDPTRELVELIRTQRAFEMNSQSIRAADEALQTVGQIRR